MHGFTPRSGVDDLRESEFCLFAHDPRIHVILIDDLRRVTLCLRSACPSDTAREVHLLHHLPFRSALRMLTCCCAPLQPTRRPTGRCTSSLASGLSGTTRDGRTAISWCRSPPSPSTRPFHETTCILPHRCCRSSRSACHACASLHWFCLKDNVTRRDIGRQSPSSTCGPQASQAGSQEKAAG